jgi:N-acetylmuramoyl-L-alanine amidase
MESYRRSPTRQRAGSERRRRPSLRVRRRRTLTAFTVVLVLVLVGIANVRHRAKGATVRSTPPIADSSGQFGGPQFGPGACVALAPTTGNRHETVFVDAGHGGPDPGGSGGTSNGQSVDERQLTLPVALDVASSLRADGYRVVLSRMVDTSVARLGAADLSHSGTLSLQGEHRDTVARVACANLSRAAVLVSVHFNAFSDASAHGLLTTYDDSRPFAAANQMLAQLVDRDVLAAMHAGGWQVPDRGVMSDTTVGTPALSAQAHQYGHLLLLGPAAPGWLDHPTTMPGVIVEPLFLTNPAEASVAADPGGQRAIATGIVSAIEAFLSAPGVSTS